MKKNFSSTQIALSEIQEKMLYILDSNYPYSGCSPAGMQLAAKQSLIEALNLLKNPESTVKQFAPIDMQDVYFMSTALGWLSRAFIFSYQGNYFDAKNEIEKLIHAKAYFRTSIYMGLLDILKLINEKDVA